MRRGRPQLDVGTYGKITTTEERRPGDGKLVYRSRATYRGSSGRTQRVIRYGETKGRAEKALKLALADMQAQTATEGITAHTSVAALAAAWMAEPHRWRPNTREQYVRVIDNHIDPKMGGLRLSEVRASTVSRVITSIHRTHGAGPALQAKKALSGMFRLAVVNDAMNANPALGTVTITQERKDVRALTVAEEEDLRDKLRTSHPSNTTKDLREALDLLGFDWVTSHVFRKTVATRLDEAGMSARVIADQLGHAKPSITQDVYMGRKVVNADAARILDR
jgi:integrase